MKTIATLQTKVDLLEGLEHEMLALRIEASTASEVPVLRAQIEELTASNASYTARIGMLEAERTDLTRLRGAEMEALTLTDAAADLRKKLDEMTKEMQKERDGRVKAEALKDEWHSRATVLELEHTKEVKGLQDRYECHFWVL